MYMNNLYSDMQVAKAKLCGIEDLICYFILEVCFLLAYHTLCQNPWSPAGGERIRGGGAEGDSAVRTAGACVRVLEHRKG
jgi:hypothetical protein